ncbi:uncharacterized protein [Triticum aestivum]|uniref:uncharacterized protein n=1 Tax=Triticum aestivum TaxID=4565 RepID=UPI001D034D4B|nr:uncharacterized protein LOC123080694 [Triticum aestivum]
MVNLQPRGVVWKGGGENLVYYLLLLCSIHVLSACACCDGGGWPAASWCVYIGPGRTLGHREEQTSTHHQPAETIDQSLAGHSIYSARTRTYGFSRSIGIVMENERNNQAPPLPPGYYPSAAAEQRQGGGGRKGFIQGCLAALCCCWICEMCCD